MTIDFFYPVPFPAPYAAWIQILRTAEALVTDGVAAEVAVGVGRGDPTPAAPAYLLGNGRGLALRRVSGPRRWAWYRGPIHRWIRSRRGVVVVRGEPAVTTLWRDRAVWRAAGVPVVFEAHRLVFAEAYERRTGVAWTPGAALNRRECRLRQRESYAIGAAAGVVCVSAGVRDAIVDLFNPTAPVRLLSSGADPPGPRGARPAAERTLDFVYAGKLVPKKGASTAVRALAGVPGRTLDVFGGTDAEVAALRGVAEGCGVADRVRLHGHVTRERVRAALDDARVSLVPLDPAASVVSAAFSSPMKLIEALAAGAVPVATAVAPVLEVVGALTDAGGAPLAHLVPTASARDPDVWAAAMGTAINEDDATRRAAGRAHARTYAWANRAAGLRSFCEGLTAGDST